MDKAVNLPLALAEQWRSLNKYWGPRNTPFTFGRPKVENGGRKQLGQRVATQVGDDGCGTPGHPKGARLGGAD